MSAVTAEDATSTEAVQTEAQTDAAETATTADATEALGDAGKKALDAMKLRVKEAEKIAKAAKTALATREAADALRDKPAEEQALEAARREATDAATRAANARILKSELRAAAGTKLANPADALAFIDLSQFDVDANGDVDADALNDAITELLTARPYLAAAKQNTFQGSADGGARATAQKSETVAERAEAALKAGDVRSSIALKTSLLRPIPVK